MQLSFFDDDPKDPRSPRNDVRTGDAAETLALFKLLNWNYDAHDTRRYLPYDIAVDLGKGQICRIQVKQQGHARKGKWNFRFARGNPRTGTGSYAYSGDDFDIAAVVARPLEKVLFFYGVHSTIRLSTSDFLRNDGEAQSWERALKVFKRKPILNQ